MPGITTSQRATAVATSATTTETVAITLPSTGTATANPSLSSLPGQGNLSNNVIEGVMNITLGTSATGFSLRCRRLSLTGTQVGTTQTITLAAATPVNVPFRFQDPASPSGAAYVITVQPIAGTGAGAINEIVCSATDYE